jgi:type II secretory pathway pseudopilin PulG
MRRSIITRHGWSLTEILVAVILLSVCLVVILRVMGSAGHGTSKAGAHSRATRLLQGLVEECRTIPWKDLEVLVPAKPGIVSLPATHIPATMAAIQAAKVGRDAGIKDFTPAVQLEYRKTKRGSPQEFWYLAEISWQEPSQSSAPATKQTVRAGGMIANPYPHPED